MNRNWMVDASKSTSLTLAVVAAAAAVEEVVVAATATIVEDMVDQGVVIKEALLAAMALAATEAAAMAEEVVMVVVVPRKDTVSKEATVPKAVTVPALNKEDMEQLKEDMVLQAAPIIMVLKVLALAAMVARPQQVAHTVLEDMASSKAMVVQRSSSPTVVVEATEPRQETKK